MLSRFFLALSLLLSTNAFSQFTVYQDDKGQLFTTFETYASSVNTGPRVQITYLGSPFLTYPVWQSGKVQLDKNSKEIDAELAYNLVTNELMCRFPDNPAVKIITPEAFSIQDSRFIRPQTALPGKSYRPYLMVVSNGPTKLLKSLSGRLDTPNSSETPTRYNPDKPIRGVYRILSDYYIQKEQSKPELINLAQKASILAVLYEQADKLGDQFSDKQVSPETVINVLARYDGLMVADRATKSPLMADPLFTQTLHDQINYPSYALSQGVYGRVYAGFDIDDQGRIKNITTLSPNNNGFRFDVSVRNALEKMPVLSSTYKGRYALPVAFTFTNTKESTEPHIPINRLADERLDGRTMLEELTVPITVTKPVTDSKEVWGYFK
ncbi:hypothetical protein GCM10028805_48860 [Spirosoma harenae]